MSLNISFMKKTLLFIAVRRAKIVENKMDL